MDTRSKIIPLEQARAHVGGKPARWVAGDFDPMLVEHVRWLRQGATAGELLVVEVTNPAKPLLSQRARAELVAALAMVDFVVMNPAGTAGDATTTERFIQHVLSRQPSRDREGAGPPA